MPRPLTRAVTHSAVCPETPGTCYAHTQQTAAQGEAWRSWQQSWPCPSSSGPAQRKSLCEAEQNKRDGCLSGTARLRRHLYVTTEANKTAIVSTSKINLSTGCILNAELKWLPSSNGWPEQRHNIRDLLELVDVLISAGGTQGAHSPDDELGELTDVEDSIFCLLLD